MLGMAKKQPTIHDEENDRWRERLKVLRDSLGLTLARMAALMKVTSRSVIAWEQGTAKIPGPARVLIETWEKQKPETGS